MISYKIARFCAEECQRQKVGPLEVAFMIKAWEYAQEQSTKGNPNLEDVIKIGQMVEPAENINGFRRHAIGIWGKPEIEFPHPTELWEQMNKWHANLVNMTPEEAYKWFEEIHPFGDGNGRTGKIIYNWLRRSLNDPIFPPNFFGGVP